ncbi:MAG: SagB/ThcOx family dehydrogenase [Polyangiaceae bacterium]
MVEGSQLVAFNYLANDVSNSLSESDRRILLATERWTTPGRLAARLDVKEAAIQRLVRAHCLVVEGTQLAEEDERFALEWEWDLRAGLFHLSTKDQGVASPERDEEMLNERIATRDPIPLYQTNEGCPLVVPMRRPSTQTGTFRALARRRTRRSFTKRRLPLQTLGDCLYAGLGITGIYIDPVPGYGKLPVKMTPSGGARNPYEAYVYTNRVTGLAPGFYHYSAFEHSLGLVAEPPLPPASELFGEQEWYDTAAAVVVLVANFKRSMWKYRHPLVYRAVLIEAGHIGQNIMVAAAHHGLATAPTALVADRQVEQILGLDHILSSVVYVVAVGAAGNAPDWGRYEKHPAKGGAARRRR